MPQDKIVVVGARENNLKNITVEIPRDKLVVITGLSGSGKSSLAFDTIYAEGQRRYVESLSAYARQFLGQMDKPDVDHIDGLSPAVSIDQKSASKNPRSTVGTVTEIYDYLRILFARAGIPYCPNGHGPIQRQSTDQIVDATKEFPEGTKLQILAPVVRERKGEYKSVLQEINRAGYVRVRVDGQMYEVTDDIPMDRYKRHTIEVIVDRVVMKEGIDRRLADSIEAALKMGKGLVTLSYQRPDDADYQDQLFSESYSCPDCGFSMPELEPRMFSFNSPFGACPGCTGLGTKTEFDPELIIPDKKKPLRDGAIAPFVYKSGETKDWWPDMLDAVGRAVGFDSRTPVNQLNEREMHAVLYGLDNDIEVRMRYGRSERKFRTKWDGVLAALKKRYETTDSDWVRGDLEQYMSTKPCPECLGKRLKPETLSVRLPSIPGRQSFAVQPVLDTKRTALAAVEMVDDEEYDDAGGFQSYLTGDEEGAAPTLHGPKPNTEHRIEDPAERARGMERSAIGTPNTAATATLDRPTRTPIPEGRTPNPIQLDGASIADLTNLPVEEALAYFEKLPKRLNKRQASIGERAVKEIMERLRFLYDVGLSYLTLDRNARTLAGGEAQRIRLATQIGSGLMGCLYILDEPSIGLHQRDNRKLIETLVRLRDIGNTVLVVEHDEETMMHADWLIDLGPGAGEHGGQIINQGSKKDFLKGKVGTAQWLNGKRKIAVPKERRQPRTPNPSALQHFNTSATEGLLRAAEPRSNYSAGNGHSINPEGANSTVPGASITLDQANPAEAVVTPPKGKKGKKNQPAPEPPKPQPGWITLTNARGHNLRNVSIDIPKGLLTCVTGVSGSGKSTLIQDTLFPRLMYEIYGTRGVWEPHDDITGIDDLDKVIDIDQSPIGRTPRSNPATYTGTFDMIRELFAMTPDAKMRGYKNGRFSFNVKGGRCEACKGDGIIKIEMHFLPDVYVPCEVCKGKRYNRETLEVRYKGKNISEVLEMTLEEATEFFKPIPKIYRKLSTLLDVGLGYIRMGQPATTLSGGEAQRIKLAAELSKRATGSTLYILDEPTTGLHFEDVEKLLVVLHRLVDQGNTVLIIEHNLDVIKTADWLIDMGPEGGTGGGQIVAVGTPEEVARVKSSHTGGFLKQLVSA